MKYTVYWTETADSTLDCILQNVENKFGFTSARKLIKEVERHVELIKENPFLFRISHLENVRKCVISKQTSLFYEIRPNNHIYLLYYWDNRQEPFIVD